MGRLQAGPPLRGTSPVARLPRRRRYTAGKLVFAAGTVIALLLCAVIAVQWIQYSRVHRIVQSYRERIAESEERNRAVRVEIDRLSSDYGYIELLARKYLGLVKPGETIFRRKD